MLRFLLESIVLSTGTCLVIGDLIICIQFVNCQDVAALMLNIFQFHIQVQKTFIVVQLIT